MERLALTLLRRLERALIYAPLTELVGERIEVQSADTALHDVLRGVTRVASISVTTMGPDLHDRAGAIAKYGILDVAYGVEATSLPIPRPGSDVLRSLGLAADTDADLEGLDAMEPLLSAIASESEGRELYLKVFLRTETPPPRADVMRRLREGMPADFWPHVFAVHDACLTNAPTAWLATHFYL